MLIIKAIYHQFNYIFHEIPDPRASSYFLMSSPIYLLVILGLYLKFVLDWGPKFMEHREPFKLDKILIAYNAFQICSSLYILYIALRYTYIFGGYSFLCEPVDTSDSPSSRAILNGVYAYFLIKISDLIDTVFFVLRKKSRQISFLHVYHHGGMLILTWMAVKYLPGGQSIFIGLLNSFVHVVMYLYYLITALYPEKKNILWWKKHLTQLQIVQFVLIALNWLALIIHPYCGYPKVIGYILLPQNLFITMLFVDFYIKAYITKK